MAAWFLYGAVLSPAKVNKLDVLINAQMKQQKRLRVSWLPLCLDCREISANCMQRCFVIAPTLKLSVRKLGDDQDPEQINVSWSLLVLIE